MHPDNMPYLPSLSGSGIDFSSTLESVEKYYFDAALKLADGNESRAASLGLSRDKFRYRRKNNPDGIVPRLIYCVVAVFQQLDILYV